MNEKKKLKIKEKKKKKKSLCNGIFYCLIHYFYMVGMFLIIAFSCRISYLLVVMVIVTMNTVAVVTANDCPLNILEQKNLSTSCLSFRSWIMQVVLPLRYNCLHKYEKTLEYLVNIWTFTGMKILTLMIWRSLRPFQIENSIGLYAMH